MFSSVVRRLFAGKAGAADKYAGTWEFTISIMDEAVPFYLGLDREGNAFELGNEGVPIARWAEEQETFVLVFPGDGIDLAFVGKLGEDGGRMRGVLQLGELELGSWTAVRKFATAAGAATTGGTARSVLARVAQAVGRTVVPSETKPPLSRAEVLRYVNFLRTGFGDLEPSFIEVRNSGEAAKHAEAAKVELQFWDSDTTFNAYAYHDSGSRKDAIAVLQGFTLATKCMALAVALSEISGSHEAMVLVAKGIGFCMQRKTDPKEFGTFTPQDQVVIAELIATRWLRSENFDEVLSRARTKFRGMLVSVMGHEMGHICYRHTLQHSVDHPPVSDEISRMHEIACDTFAAAVISDLPYKNENCMSGMLPWVLFAWLEGENANPMLKTTHPKPRERVSSYFTHFDKYLATLGVTWDTVQTMLPQ